MPRNHHKQRCAAITHSGAQCRNWAKRPAAQQTGALPLCNFHQPRWPPAEEESRARRRCTAITRNGQRCPNWGMLGADPAVCNIHAGRIGQQNQHRRCVMPMPDGSRCRRRGIRHSDPPLCPSHQPDRGRPPEARQCAALTQSGKRCTNWVTTSISAAVPALCHVHAAGILMPGDQHQYAHRRCAAKTHTGAQCQNWAMHDSVQTLGRPLCAIHAGRQRTRMPGPGERRCRARNLSGSQCRYWASAADDHGLCWKHAHPEANPRLRHGYHQKRPYFGELERAYLAASVAGGQPLAAELFVARLKLAHLLAYLDAGVGPNGLSQYSWLTGYRLMFRSMRAISRLVRTRHQLTTAEAGSDR